MRQLPHSHFVDLLRPKLVEILYRLGTKPVSARRVFNRIPSSKLRKHFDIKEIEQMLLDDPQICTNDTTATLKFSTEWEPEAGRNISWRRK